MQVLMTCHRNNVQRSIYKDNEHKFTKDALQKISDKILEIFDDLPNNPRLGIAGLDELSIRISYSIYTFRFLPHEKDTHLRVALRENGGKYEADVFDVKTLKEYGWMI